MARFTPEKIEEIMAALEQDIQDMPDLTEEDRKYALATTREFLERQPGPWKKGLDD